MKRNKHKNIYVDKCYEGNYEYVILVNYKILTNRQIIRHENIIFLEERNIFRSNETEIHDTLGAFLGSLYPRKILFS